MATTPAPAAARILALASILPLLLAAACGDDSAGAGGAGGGEPGAGASGPEGEACQFLADGPDKTLTAALDAESAPLITKGGAYTVQLNDSIDYFSGWIRFEAPKDGEYYVLADQDYPFDFFDADGTADVYVEDRCRGGCEPECEDAGLRDIAVLTAGTYSIYFQGYDIDPVIAIAYPD